MICGANVKYRLSSIGGWQLATSARLIQALVSYSVIVTVAGAGSGAVVHPEGPASCK